MDTKKLLKEQSGFTLLELLLVVGVGALLLIGGISTYRLVSENNKITETSRLLLQVKQEVQNIYRTQANYAGLTVADTAPANLVTIKRTLGLPVNLRNTFNGSIFVGAQTGGNSFSIALTGIPASACVKLAPIYTDTTDLTGLRISSTAATSFSTTVSSTVTAAMFQAGTATTAAITQCTQDGMVMEWFFR